jgi:hypothetical protein
LIMLVYLLNSIGLITVELPLRLFDP